MANGNRSADRPRGLWGGRRLRSARKLRACRTARRRTACNLRELGAARGRHRELRRTRERQPRRILLRCAGRGDPPAHGDGAAQGSRWARDRRGAVPGRLAVSRRGRLGRGLRRYHEPQRCDAAGGGRQRQGARSDHR